MLVNSPDYLAWKACIVAGNHNNTPLIDRAVSNVIPKLWDVQDATGRAIREFWGWSWREYLQRMEAANAK